MPTRTSHTAQPVLPSRLRRPGSCPRRWRRPRGVAGVKVVVVFSLSSEEGQDACQFLLVALRLRKESQCRKGGTCFPATRVPRRLGGRRSRPPHCLLARTSRPTEAPVRLAIPGQLHSAESNRRPPLYTKCTWLLTITSKGVKV